MTLGFAPETIEVWPLDRLQPYARNAKTHGPDQVAKIAASIAEFGWTVAEHLTIGLAFVAVSLARGYLLRRLFEAIRARTLLR